MSRDADGIGVHVRTLAVASVTVACMHRAGFPVLLVLLYLLYKTISITLSDESAAYTLK